MTSLSKLLLLAVFLPGAAWAQDGPPAGYFAGEYEVVGRTPGPDGTALLDWLRIQAEGDRLILKACRSGEGHLSPNPSPSETAAPLIGTLGPWSLSCHFMGDSDNYPRLSCYAVTDDAMKVPGLLNFWPVRWEPPAHAQSCQ
ncbi:unnamed protein product [Ectocarpus sp. 13 AM-2016]